LLNFISIALTGDFFDARGSSAAVACRSDPHPRAVKVPGKLVIGKYRSFNEFNENMLKTESKKETGRTPEEIYLDEIVEEAAASMINVSLMSSNCISSKEVRVRSRFYECLLKEINPKVLTKNRIKCGSLLTDCDFEIRNRLMKFDDRTEGRVTPEDRDLVSGRIVTLKYV